MASVVHLIFRCSTESNSGSPRHTFALGKEEHTEVPPSLLMDDLGLTTAGQSISFFLCVKARSESKTVFGTDIPEGFLNQLQGV